MAELTPLKWGHDRLLFLMQAVQMMPICRGVDFEPVVAGRVVLEDTREPRLVVPKAGAVVRWDDRAVKQ